ncbi:MAG: hypothetical protein LBG76_03925 [Treponema sp.]|jgi:hypothetical protein|nr:hypothetical protein [Treponema sp.]
MKRITVVLRTILFMAVLASFAAAFAACSGGVFTDPGAGGGGGGDSSSGLSASKKPAALSTSASYSEADAKLDEIIKYCGSSSKNANVKTAAEQMKTSMSSSGWSYSGSTFISSINQLIGTLQ